MSEKGAARYCTGDTIQTKIRISSCLLFPFLCWVFLCRSDVSLLIPISGAYLVALSIEYCCLLWEIVPKPKFVKDTNLPRRSCSRRRPWSQQIVFPCALPENQFLPPYVRIMILSHTTPYCRYEIHSVCSRIEEKFRKEDGIILFSFACLLMEK